MIRQYPIYFNIPQTISITELKINEQYNKSYYCIAKTHDINILLSQLNFEPIQTNNSESIFIITISCKFNIPAYDPEIYMKETIPYKESVNNISLQLNRFLFVHKRTNKNNIIIPKISISYTKNKLQININYLSFFKDIQIATQ